MEEFFNLFPQGAKRLYEVKITIHKAENLRMKEGVALNPFCKVSIHLDKNFTHDNQYYLDQDIRKSSKKIFTSDPEWNEDFIL